MKDNPKNRMSALIIISGLVIQLAKGYTVFAIIVLIHFGGYISWLERRYEKRLPTDHINGNYRLILVRWRKKVKNTHYIRKHAQNCFNILSERCPI